MYCRLHKPHVFLSLAGRPAASCHDTYLSCHTSRPRITSEFKLPQIVTMLGAWGAEHWQAATWENTWLICRKTRGLRWETSDDRRHRSWGNLAVATAWFPLWLLACTNEKALDWRTFLSAASVNVKQLTKFIFLRAKNGDLSRLGLGQKYKLGLPAICPRCSKRIPPSRQEEQKAGEHSDSRPFASLPTLYSTRWAGEMAPVRSCFRSGDAALAALLASTALASVQSYSLGSVFGGSSIGLRSQTSGGNKKICFEESRRSCWAAIKNLSNPLGGCTCTSVSRRSLLCCVD